MYLDWEKPDTSVKEYLYVSCLLENRTHAVKFARRKDEKYLKKYCYCS